MHTILGIRHHGPGSARSVRHALESLQPDVILVEGPPDANPLLEFTSNIALEPPVALLGYQPGDPQQAVFYPFARFSPEWQAIQYAQNKQIPLRFMDLPLMHRMALDTNTHFHFSNKEAEQPQNEQEAANQEIPDLSSTENSNTQVLGIHQDPLKYLAEAAGYQESELWWEHTFEQRLDATQVFEAILESMTVLRNTLPAGNNPLEILREAYMRKVIYAAEKEGFSNIAIICGAWHAPALVEVQERKKDEELLKKLPKVKVAFTWIPWTYSRLTFASGYGAGIHSPGWYEHLWDFPQDTSIRWLTKVARLLRQKNMDTSAAHIIEAVRLADMLAVMRSLSKPGLIELNEATRTVMCFGEDVLMQLIEDELIFSNKLGSVPSEVPKVPLQHDLEKEQSRLKLQPQLQDKVYVLDLRQTNDLERSKLLHRLLLLQIKWGRWESVSGKGTFKEQWVLRWQPELLVKVIEMGVWGNTVAEAATAYVSHQSKQLTQVSEAARLLENSIPAELPVASGLLMKRIDELASQGADIIQLMQAFTPLVQVSRYGNVRKTDTVLLRSLVDRFIARICIGLPNACFAMDTEGASEMSAYISDVNQAIALLQEENHLQLWHQTLTELSDKPQLNGLISGYACRLLLDAKVLFTEQITLHFSQALSVANDPAYSAAWLEGFLKGSGMILLLDNILWQILNQWVAHLQAETFAALLPLLRRTFSNFSPSERRKMGEKARSESSVPVSAASSVDEAFDPVRAEQVLPILQQLLGL